MKPYKNIIKILTYILTVDDIHWNEYVWPVCFSSTNLQLTGQEAIVIGWGKRSEKSDIYSERLQKVKLVIIDSQQCAEWFKLAGRDFVISDRILCAGYREGKKDACHGDSGGPLLLKQKSSKCQCISTWVTDNTFFTANGVDFYTVAGIVSTGIGKC